MVRLEFIALQYAGDAETFKPCLIFHAANSCTFVYNHTLLATCIPFYLHIVVSVATVTDTTIRYKQGVSEASSLLVPNIHTMSCHLYSLSLKSRITLITVRVDVGLRVTMLSLTLGTHAQKGLQYLSCVYVCVSVRLLPQNLLYTSFVRQSCRFFLVFL